MRIIVTGATSQIGKFLLPKLISERHQVIAIGRKEKVQKEVIWLQQDLMNLNEKRLPEADVLIHIASLPLLEYMVDAIPASGIKKIIAFSSTSIFTKSDSPDSEEREMIDALILAESHLQRMSEKNAIGWTLFRPTLIYGAGMDKNVEFIRSVINRIGIFPVVGNGDALRQPVHAEDLAIACIQALNNPESLNKVYNLPGGETLTYRQMVKRIFVLCSKPVRIVHLPEGLIKICISILRTLPKYRYLNKAMVDRMQMDMIFSHDDATKDFAYSPRSFQPEFRADRRS